MFTVGDTANASVDLHRPRDLFRRHHETQPSAAPSPPCSAACPPLSVLALLALSPACEDDNGGTATDAATPPRDGGPDTSAADAAAGDTASGDSASGDTSAALAPVTCTGQTDKTKPIADPAPRKVYCALDLGSNNIKLQVLSMEEGKPLSFKDERQCRTRLGFGAKVFDSADDDRQGAGRRGHRRPDHGDEGAAGDLRRWTRARWSGPRPPSGPATP